MRNKIIYILLFVVIFSGCKKASTVLKDNVTLSQLEIEQLERQSALLTKSDFGWKAYLYPSNGGGYAFYMNFDTANKVTMYADLDYSPSAMSKESSYQIKKAETPSLLFDTYNYMYVLNTVHPATFGGLASWDIYNDFEFNFDEQAGDTLKLNGRLLDSKLILVKATATESEAYNSRVLFNSVSASVNYIDHHPSLYINLAGETKIQISFNYLNKVFSLAWEEDGIIHTSSSPFVFTLNGILLRYPLVYKDQIVSEFTWDAAKSVFFIARNGKRTDVLASAIPVLPLHVLIGVNYSSITVPKASVYPGWSDDFQARRATAAAATLATSYWLRLEKMVFAFNSVSRTMNIRIDIYQDATLFIANFGYNYTKTSAGIYKFTAIVPVGNAALIADNMAALTAQRLNTDSFMLSYLLHPSTGQLLGQFVSLEHPDFSFSGTLQ